MLQNIRLIVDRCKNTAEERKDFNTYLGNQLEASIPTLDVIVDIFHEDSQKYPELQAVDLFCWGVHRKVTYNETDWFNIFADKIRSSDVYLR